MIAAITMHPQTHSIKNFPVVSTDSATRRCAETSPYMKCNVLCEVFIRFSWSHCSNYQGRCSNARHVTALQCVTSALKKWRLARRLLNRLCTSAGADACLSNAISHRCYACSVKWMALSRRWLTWHIRYYASISNRPTWLTMWLL